MKEQEFDFETWFDIFIDKVRSLKYAGPVDKDSAQMSYYEGQSPENAAKDFVEEMNS